MKQLILSAAPLLLLACSDDALPTEAEGALPAISDLNTISLITTEVASQVISSSTREASPCPEIIREGSATDFTVTADYGEGCVPDSGLVVDEVSGAAHVGYADKELTVGFSALSTYSAQIDGAITGSYESAGSSGLVLLLDSALTLATVEGELVVAESLVASVGLQETSLDGQGSLLAPYGSYEAVVDRIAYRYADLTGTCYLPYTGSVSVDVDGQSVTVAFDEDSPETGIATVTYRGQSWEVLVCDYVGALQ